MEPILSFLLLRRQFLLLVLEDHIIVYFIFFRFQVFVSHQLPFWYSLHHFPQIPGSNRVVIWATVEHLISKCEWNYAIIMACQFLYLLHLWPFVYSDFTIIAACVHVPVVILDCQCPSVYTFDHLFWLEFLHKFKRTSAFSGLKSFRS